jgi:starvation-inducible outer membrane lipoprotein
MARDEISSEAEPRPDLRSDGRVIACEDLHFDPQRVERVDDPRALFPWRVYIE